MGAIKTFLFSALVDTSSLPKPGADQAKIDAVLGIAFGVMGTVAVLVIVLGGFRYVVSRGEPREMAQARQTIIYALVGLGVTIMSYAIVSFVVRSI